MLNDVLRRGGDKSEWGYPDGGALACGWGDGGAAVGCTRAVSKGPAPMLNSSEFVQVLFISAFKKAKQVGWYLSFHWRIIRMGQVCEFKECSSNRFALSVLRYLLRLSPGSSQQSNPEPWASSCEGIC